MSIRLFPRLSQTLALELIEKSVHASAADLEVPRELLPSPGITWAPTGGNRLTEQELQDLREVLRQTARGCGYQYDTDTDPIPERSDERYAFDRALMHALRDRFPLTPYEASQSGVWRYIACILAPELVRWRWRSNSDNTPITAARFKGSIYRNTFGRLWWRAESFYDEHAENPYGLVERMGEDEIFQLYERGRSVVVYRPLACSVVRNLADIMSKREEIGITSSEKLLRQSMMRLVRLRPMICLEGLDNAQLDGFVRGLFQATLTGLGIAYTLDIAPDERAADGPLPDPLWPMLSRERSFAFHNALTDAEVETLQAITSHGPGPWLEMNSRWRQQLQLTVPCTVVLNTLGEQSRQRLAEALQCQNLHAWLVSEEPGTWVTQTRPDRARQLLNTITFSTMRQLASTSGWAWDLTMFESAARQELRRRYNGRWEDVIAVLSDEDYALLSGKGVARASADDREEALKAWLLVDSEEEVTPDSPPAPVAPEPEATPEPPEPPPPAPEAITTPKSPPETTSRPDTSWLLLSRTRTYALVEKLSLEDIKCLTPLSNEGPGGWMEYSNRWRLLFRLSRPCSEVLAALGPDRCRALAETLGCSDLHEWLLSDPPGSWITGVRPEAGCKLVAQLGVKHLQVITNNASWTHHIYPFASQLEFRRRYNGSIEEVVDTLPIAVYQALVRLGDLPGDSPDYKATVTEWLRGEPSPEAEEMERAATVTVATVTQKAPVIVSEAAPSSQTADDVVSEPHTGSPIPLPTPPGLIQATLERLKVTTVRELVSLDPQSINLQGVGRKKIETIQSFQEEVLARHPAVADQLPTPLPTPPDILKNLLIRLNLTTVEDVLAYDVRILKQLPRVGWTRQKAMADWQKELVEKFSRKRATPPPPPPIPMPPEDSLDAMADWLIERLDERQQAMVRVRYEEGGTLQDTGNAIGVSRERARQLLRATMNDHSRQYGLVIQAKLNEVYRLEETDGWLIRLGITPGLAPWKAHFLIESATTTSWHRVDEAHLCDSGQSAFSQLLQTLRADLPAHGGLSVESLNTLAEKHDLSPALTRYLLITFFGWISTADGVLLPNIEDFTASEWLNRKLRSHGKPAHQGEVAGWLMDREGIDETRREEEFPRFFRMVEGRLDRLEDVYRYQRGTFIHRDALNIDAEDLVGLIDRCVERIRGQTGPISTLKLLTDLRKSDPAPTPQAVTPHLLKYLLARHPEVLPLRKFHVACRATYEEDGVELKDRIQAILQAADRPLTLEEVADRLPAEAAYSINSVNQALYALGANEGGERGMFSAESGERADG